MKFVRSYSNACMTQPQSFFGAGSLMSWSNGWPLSAILKPISVQINQETIHEEQEERRNGGEGNTEDREMNSGSFSLPSSSVLPFLLLKFKQSNYHVLHLGQRENRLVLIAKSAKEIDHEIVTLVENSQP